LSSLFDWYQGKSERRGITTSSRNKMEHEQDKSNNDNDDDFTTIQEAAENPLQGTCFDLYWHELPCVIMATTTTTTTTTAQPKTDDDIATTSARVVVTINGDSFRSHMAGIQLLIHDDYRTNTKNSNNLNKLLWGCGT
jgi:hypothetical protein